MYKVVHKPWGKEEWLELNDSYCYKRIYINAGYKTSYQYHKFKKETNYIIDGKAEVWLEDDNGIVQKKILKAGQFFNVFPPKKHRVIAITDIILQEVSTPEVDDVFRINDEFNREDGKIEAEHKTPAVLILSAGIGSRLNSLTNHINKALLPINNEAIISRIIKKFSKNYEFVITLGYRGDVLKEFLKLSFPKHKFIFVEIDNFDGPGSGPGTTAKACKKYLQRPFYFIVSDCIIESPIPHLDGNWLGVQETGFPEKYSTLEIDQTNNIKAFKEKSIKGYKYAFTGLASIWDHETFWNELDANSDNGEIVSAFYNPKNYKNFKAKKLKWFDTGNLDDLNTTKKFFNDEPISLEKTTGQISYVGENFIKFNPNREIIKNITKRAEILENLVPNNFQSSNHFIKYKWMDGKTLYEIDSLKVYNNFLSFFENLISNSRFNDVSIKSIKKFYIDKTMSRVDSFIQKHGDQYLNDSFIINGTNHKPMKSYLENISDEKFKNSKNYMLFHGDLQFDNVIYQENTRKFLYIDWRDSFADDTKGGDLYYDLAKLYGGLIFNYYDLKKQNVFSFEKGDTLVNFNIITNKNLSNFLINYEKWLNKNNYDLEYIRFLTGIIFLNMSPLHNGDFGKILWFKSLEIFSDANR